MPSSTLPIPLRIKITQKNNPYEMGLLQSTICVKRNGSLLDIIDRETALDLHQKRIIHFDPRRKVAFILSSNRDYVYYREGGTCFYCHTPLSRQSSTMDHLHPKSRGGEGSVYNLVLSCRQCNSLKGNRNVNRFLLNPYNIIGRTNMGKPYFITEKAILDFQKITHNFLCTPREIYYYFCNESIYYKKHGDILFYFSPRFLFICQGHHITQIKPNTFLNRIPLYLRNKECNDSWKEESFLYLPGYQVIQQYRKIHQKHVPVDSIIKKLNNVIFFENNTYNIFKNTIWIFHKKYMLVLHNKTICFLRQTSPFLSPLLEKIFPTSGKKLLYNTVTQLHVPSQTIKQYRYLIRNSPVDTIYLKIRNMLLYNTNIFRLVNQQVILRSGKYLFTVAGRNIIHIHLLGKRAFRYNHQKK